MPLLESVWQVFICIHINDKAVSGRLYGILAQELVILWLVVYHLKLRYTILAVRDLSVARHRKECHIVAQRIVICQARAVSRQLLDFTRDQIQCECLRKHFRRNKVQILDLGRYRKYRVLLLHSRGSYVQFEKAAIRS